MFIMNFLFVRIVEKWILWSFRYFRWIWESRRGAGVVIFINLKRIQ